LHVALSRKESIADFEQMSIRTNSRRISKRALVLIGACLAGFVCARRLQEAGVNFQLVEAADDFGGSSDFSNQFCYSSNH
jgi:cation diffusion facilitator CzcD-associated flavoprotein CzcO